MFTCVKLKIEVHAAPIGCYHREKVMPHCRIYFLGNFNRVEVLMKRLDISIKIGIGCIALLLIIENYLPKSSEIEWLRILAYSSIAAFAGVMLIYPIFRELNVTKWKVVTADGEQVVLADSVDVLNGDIIFLNNHGKMIKSCAKGYWIECGLLKRNKELFKK